LASQIKIINTQTAQNVWENSLEANIFNKPELLNTISKIYFYGCFSNDKIVAVWPIYETKKNNSEIPWNFYYFGPFFDNIIEAKPLHSKLSKKLEIFEAYLIFFKSRIKELNFRLHWQDHDIRYFKWLEERLKFFKVSFDPKYTALLKNKYDINNWRALRRRQLKKIETCKNNFYFINKNDTKISEYLNIIKENIPINIFNESKNLYEIMIKICKQQGECTEIFDKANDCLIGFACILRDKISHNLVFNFVKQDWKEKGLMVYLYKTLFDKCFETNTKYFDFNGANSNKGADEKSTFGSYAKLYFDIKIKFI
jgi:hypothetical protein